MGGVSFSTQTGIQVRATNIYCGDFFAIRASEQKRCEAYKAISEEEHRMYID